MTADGLSLIAPTFGYGIYIANGASDNVIGAGAVIMADTADRGVYAAPRAGLMPLPSNRLPRI